MVWHVDTKEYKSAYWDAISNAQAHLPPHLLATISRPQAISAHQSYRDAQLRLMILGQETFNNYAPLAVDQPFFSWSHTVGEYVVFDFAYGGDGQASGPFWQAFDRFREAFSRADRRSIAWSNICKSQLSVPRSGRVSLSILPAADRVHIKQWQAALLHAEINYLAPHGILAFIGLNGWHEHLLRSMYQNVHEDKYDADGYRVWSHPGMPFCLVSTYHPNARNAAVNPVLAAQNATAALKRCLQARGFVA